MSKQGKPCHQLRWFCGEAAIERGGALQFWLRIGCATVARCNMVQRSTIRQRECQPTLDVRTCMVLLHEFGRWTRFEVRVAANISSWKTQSWNSKLYLECILSRKRATLSSAEVLVYQFCLFHFNSLSFDSLSVRLGGNEALVPYY